ncbi:MAG: CapA family protein [Candidatus Wildermuthbacteria bacterium]|nr:CapA family protein [Candidatus Wildermuthbacteria bacterium]
MTIRIALIILFGILFWGNPAPGAPEKTGAEETVTLLFVGDIMLDRGVEFYTTRHNDWRWPFLKIADFLRKADLVFGNLESVISDKGENQGSIYSFRADPRALEGLVFAGIDVVSVANNHSFDYGPEAFADSASRLKKTGITPVGIKLFSAIAHNNSGLEIREVKGTTLGFLAYTNAGSPLWQATQTTPGVAWVDEYTIEDFQNTIREAKQQSDILVVSLHFGEEYQTQPSYTQKFIAESAIDAGADIVIGHHPHVVQPVEQYKDGWIAWSLGNFVFDQGFSKETMEGLLLEVKIEGKKIAQVIPRAIRINSLFQPELVAY